MSDAKTRGDELVEAAIKVLADPRAKGGDGVRWTISHEAERDMRCARHADIVAAPVLSEPPTLLGIPVEVRAQDEPIHLISEPANES